MVKAGQGCCERLWVKSFAPLRLFKHIVKPYTLNFASLNEPFCQTSPRYIKRRSHKEDNSLFLQTAEAIQKNVLQRPVKKTFRPLRSDVTIRESFFRNNSPTRTRSSFELAEKKIKRKTRSTLQPPGSSVSKV
jgi:hypothetical protein